MSEVEQTWLTDSRGNRCSVEFFGSKEAAQAVLDGLKDCDDCTNCSDCSDCSGCSRCSDCSRCSRCSDCSDCSGCSGCSGCSRCSRCSRCSDCSDCSDCSGCSRCSRCSDCSDLKNSKPVEQELGAPPIPKIDNIHAKIYAAISQPQALDMSSWHSCETTHCRAGWVVHLAGDAGYALEQFHNTELAAMLIYDASGYEINPARFFDSNEKAKEHMRQLAEQEQAA